MNNKFKGLYDNEKTSFITDRTNNDFYEPEIKTPHTQVHNYSINFDKKELYKQLEEKDKEINILNNITNELEKLIDGYDLGKYDYSIPVFILKDRLKELKENKNENSNKENN